MNNISRRSFIKRSVATAATVSLSARAWQRVLGANDDIRVAVVGFKGRGGSHIDAFSKMDGVRIVGLCDVDENVLNSAARKLEKHNPSIETVTDVRKLLENKDIDVISTATPNHWHALISVWACQAGKDVYVEKPVSHNVWEGRQIVLASRKYKRIVQTGTQSRSSSGIAEGIKWVHDGNLGKIKLVRGLCYKRRASIGKTTGDQPIPPGVDYDLWCGPAPKEPLRRKNLHYDWHWVWPTGNGDLGNQGIHQMDIARWALGVQELSPKIMSIGGRLGYEDDGTTPNTLVVMHDYDKAPLFFEVRGLPDKTDSKNMDVYKGASIGVIVHCENGWLTIPNYDSAIAHDSDGKKIKEFKGSSDHFANFITAVRSRKYADLHADIEQGHLSSALCHTGNISYRLGAGKSPDDITDAIKSDKDATETFGRMKEHLAANDVDLTKTKAALGVWLKMNPKTETFVNNAAASAMLTRDYRKPFVVPKDV